MGYPQVCSFPKHLIQLKKELITVRIYSDKILVMNKIILSLVFVEPADP